MTKRQLMARFDAWGTDPAVTRAGVEAFVADKSNVGRRYLGRYAVWTSSGISGEPGIFVHDANAVAVYRALTLVRGLVAWMTPARLWAMLRQGDRVATVVATGGHYVSVSMMGVARRARPWPFNRVRVFSVLRPEPEVVRALNRFKPAELIGYPTVLMLLAREQLAGRLAIRPALVGYGGEWLAPGARREIVSAFGGPVRENYGASEFTRLAWGCLREGLHVSADWGILEPVDEHYQPVPPGRASYTTLLTNLANRVQPIIRYDLGDSITTIPVPCPCGSPLPLIRVEGRRDEMVYLETSRGGTVPLLPLALIKLVEETPGVQRCQVVQTGRATLSVRLEVAPSADDGRVWEAVARGLRAYLSAHRLPLANVERAPERPSSDRVSGKFRQVWAAPGATSGVRSSS
ncbi:MAG: phenylacetate--CoA ligase family protein [Chloroflexi bacterium]|nr:phenylacetate--CoA ligase family protein [Chloroflexota bacterium]